MRSPNSTSAHNCRSLGAAAAFGGCAGAPGGVHMTKLAPVLAIDTGAGAEAAGGGAAAADGATRLPTDIAGAQEAACETACDVE